jgi:predicted Zn-dependent protease
MTQNTSSQKPLMRFLTILSGLAFAGTSIFGLAGLFTKAFQEPQKNAQTATDAQTSQLQAQERGYEAVLQREPDNQIALQGLVQIRLQKNDLQGAISPMEKLFKLNPDNQIALQGLVQIRLQKNDLQGAISPMEKLVKLNPDNAQYKALLAGIKQRVGTTGTTEKKGDR